MTELVRLSKLMSQRGLSSRREADRLIEQGLVRVNGELVNTLGVKFPEDVEIELTKRAQAMQNELVTIMINKPVGYVSAQAEDDYVPAVRLITDDNHSDIDQTGIRLKGNHFDGLARLAWPGLCWPGLALTGLGHGAWAESCLASWVGLACLGLGLGLAWAGLGGPRLGLAVCRLAGPGIG